MRQTTSMMGADGTVYDIPDDEMEAFKADFGDSARPVQNFRADGTDYTIPDDEAEAFLADFPNAEKTRRISFADGSSKDMTVGEMAEFLRSDEYRNGEKYAKDRELARADAENKARVANAGNEPGSPFVAGLKETGRRMFTAEGIREGAEESVFAKPYAYANDLANSLVKGLLGGSAKITEGVGTLTGIGAVRDAGRADQQMLERNFPTNMLDTSGGGVVNKVLETGKGVAAVTGEFAPAAIPGVGQAYAASLVGAGAANRADAVYDEAVANGASVAEATSLAMGAGAVDALGNMLLMGKFKGIWGGAQKGAADAAKQGVVRKLLGETVRTGAIMGGQAGAGNAIDQMAKAQDFSAGEMAEAALDGFIEGGMFHLVNTGMHAAVRPDWQTKPKGMPDGMARDVLDTAEGRALVASNSPEAAKRMIEVREKGGDVSRKMLRDMGVPDSVAPTVADRNALGDSIAADFKAYREAVTQIKRTKLDGQQYQALSEEVAKRVGTDQSEDYGKAMLDVLGEIKDAKELDDPYRREELVGKAVERLYADENARAEADATAKSAEREARKEDAAAAFNSPEFEEQTRAREEREAQNRTEGGVEGAGARAETETGKEKGVATEGAEVPSRADGEVVEKAGEESAQKKYTPEEAAALKKKGKAVPEDQILKTEEVEANKETREEKPDETGNGAAEEPSKPEQGVERPEGKPEAPRSLAGSEKGGKAHDEGVVGDEGVRIIEASSETEDGTTSYIVRFSDKKNDQVIYKSREQAEKRAENEREFRRAVKSAPTATLSDGSTVHLLKTEKGWVPYDDYFNNLTGGMFSPSKTKDGAIKHAEMYRKWVKDVTETNRKSAASSAETPENKPQTAEINKKSVYSGEEAAKTEPKAEEVRDSMRGDPVLQRIDAEFKKAKTDEERNALKEQFAARVAELRKKGKKVPKGAEPTAEEAAEVKAAEAEQPKADEIEKMTDEELKKRIEDVFNNSEDMEPDEFKRAIKPYRDEQNRRKEASKTDADRQKESLDRAFGDFTDENGKPKTITQLIDNGWRFEKKKVGAAHRYRLVKDGVDAYHDLSSKKVRSLMRPGNYDLNIKAIEEYSNSVHKPDAAEAKKTGDTAKPEEAPKAETKAEKKPTKRGQNLKGYSFEDYGAEPNTDPATRDAEPGGTGDVIGSQLLRWAKDRGGLLSVPESKDDPLWDWIKGFNDGNAKKNRRGDYVALFGMKTRKGRNDNITEDMPPELKEYIDGVIARDGIEALPEMFLKARKKYADWVAKKRNAQRQTKANKAEEDAAFKAEAEERANAGYLSLESLTPEQMEAEKAKLAEQQKEADEKAELERRKNAPLKGGTGDLGQGKLNLGGAEGDRDLFNVDLESAVDSDGKPLLSKNMESPLKPEAKPKEPKGAEFANYGEARAKNATRIELKNAQTPEQEIEARLDMKRLDPKRRSDTKVLEWAKKTGRRIENGMVLPDAVRAYDEHMTKETAKLAKRWFPDMNIVQHKFGEHIKRGQHVLDRLVDDEGIIKAFENEDGTITVYRAVQVNEKGEVRPPQSTRVQESDGKIVDRPAEGYVDKDGNIRSASGGSVVIKAEERPDLAHRVKNRDGTWKKVTERDVKDGRYPPEMLGADKWFFDLKKAKGTGSTDDVVYDPYMHSSDTPLNDQFTSAWKRPDWRIAVSRILKSDLESGYRADKAGLSVGAHEWKGGAVDNQLPKNMKRKVFLTQHLKMERILSEAEAARILKEKWGEMGLKLEIPDSRVSPTMREALIKEGFNVVKTGDVQYLRDRAGNTLGWFDPKSKEVHLLPGADAETVGHEILWHGTRDYATKRAAQGDTRAQKLLDMMHDVENNVPPAMRTQILHAYRKTPGLTRDMLLNEFGAWFTQKKFGAALEEALKTKEGQNWFAKAFTTVKEMYKDYLTAHGKNRIDLDKIDGMSRDQFIDFMAEQFAGGKTLGNIKGDNLLSTEETKWQARRRKYYDNNAPVRDLERDVEKKTGRKISADDSVEAANALKHGLKEAANIEIQGKLKNFKQALHEAGLHIEDFEYYAQLRAAAGRDAKIDKRNLAEIERKMKAKGASQDEIDAAKAAYRSTNGSHVSPEEARKLLAEINASPDKAKFEALWDEMQSIIKETLDTQVEAGLVSKEAAEAWRKEEPEYIPFKNEYDAESGDWSGRGSARDFTRPEVYTAKGRQSAAGDIVAHVFMDHQAAKHRAIENAVRQKLAKLVSANPEIGKVEAVDADAWKGLEKDDPNVVTFKEGGQSYVIRLNGTRGAAIANAFTQRNLLKMGWADKGFSVFGKKISFRTFSQVSSGLATRYSPTFFVRNFTKDNIELANIIYSERGPIEGTKWIASYVKSQATMAWALAKYVATEKIDATPEGDILKRYIKAGGLIAGGVQAEGMASLKEQLTPESILKEAKHGKSKAYAAGKFVLDSIGKLNEFGELATRLNAFATEVRSGKSDAEAALFSRRATVDFNRHGDYTPAFNMIRLFSNSSLGATARAAVALGKSKYGKAAAASLFTLGLSQALIEHFANQDEDERRKKTGEATGKDVSEFDRETALFYFRKGDRVYKVAQHSSPFSLINYAGNCVGRWLCGDLKGEDMAKNLGLTAAEMAYMFMPMGSINARSRKGDLVSDAKAAIVSGVVPSSLQPLFEMAFDMDYKGDAVFRHMMNSQDPKSHNGKNSAPEWAKDAAEWMNDATGGNAGKPGKIDLAPEAIQKLVEGFGKNLGKDISMAVNIGEALIKGEFGKIGPRETPVKRDFVKQIDGNDRRFNDSLSTYNSDMNEWRKMRDEWTKEQRAEYKKAHPWVISDRAKELKKQINELHKRENGMTNRSGKWKKAETPPTDEQIEQWRTRRRKLQAEFLTKLGGE